MKIGFIAEPYEERGASGMGYVVLEFLRNLALAEGDTLTIYSSIPIKKEIIPTAHINVIVPKSLVGKFFYFLFFREQIDSLLFMSPLLPLWLPHRIKTVVLCQELGSQKMPVEGLRDKMLATLRDHILMPTCLARASKIVVPSQATKTDIHTYYRVADEKVKIIFDGYQDLSDITPVLRNVLHDIGPFFFFTGRVKYRKNVHGIVSAFISFVERTEAMCSLVIAGGHGGGYYQAMLEELRAHGLEKRVFFLGYVSVEELVGLYKNAIGFVFPSFNEGFGMPPVEAMSLGLPVITSNISSTAEIVADAGLLVDPHNTEDISNAMEKIFFDSNLRESIIKKGYQRAKDFSWSRSGRELAELLHSI